MQIAAFFLFDHIYFHLKFTIKNELKYKKEQSKRNQQKKGRGTRIETETECCNTCAPTG